LWSPSGLPDFRIETYLAEVGAKVTSTSPDDDAVVQLQNSDEKILLKNLQPAGSVILECTDCGPGMSAV
jgi:hypothetical protein